MYSSNSATTIFLYTVTARAHCKYKRPKCTTTKVKLRLHISARKFVSVRFSYEDFLVSNQENLSKSIFLGKVLFQTKHHKIPVRISYVAFLKNM